MGHGGIPLAAGVSIAISWTAWTRVELGENVMKIAGNWFVLEFVHRRNAERLLDNTRVESF